MKKLVFIVLLLLCSNVVFGQMDSLKVISLQHKIELLENEVKQVRSNQLDYKLEKDLLKETYSSNYSTAQIILTLIFGVVTLISFLGLRSVNELKTNFEKEHKEKLTSLENKKNDFENDYKEKLQELKQLKTNFDKDYDDFNAKRIEIDERIEKVELESSERNKKLETLELTEKIINAIRGGEYHFALSYLDIVIKENPQDINLLTYKILVLKELKEYGKSITVYNILLSVVQNEKYVFELGELLLLTDKTQEFIELKSNYWKYFKMEANPIVFYLNSFYYQLLDFEKQNKLKDPLNTQQKLVLESFDDNLTITVLNWRFDLIEEYVYFNKEISKEFIYLIKGFINRIQEAKKSIHYTPNPYLNIKGEMI